MSNERTRILVVDDEEIVRESLGGWLEKDGYSVHVAADGFAAVEKLKGERWSILIVDLKMPGMDGLQVLEEAKKLLPELAVVIMTAYATVDTAVAAMKLGAYDYLVKPFDPEELSLMMQKIVSQQTLVRENAVLRQALKREYKFRDLLSKSPAMQSVFELARTAARSNSTILVLGESGSGKEVLARAIHQESPRAEGPFVAVSCAALTESLLESELFGHEKGAFTGAIARRKGKFEAAHGGTLFLDEVGDIGPKLQLDLLRVLEERRFHRIGGNESVDVDVRIIAATNRDLKRAVAEGKFREDLFYRLNVIPILIPPLRDRREDVPLLVESFVERLSVEMKKRIDGVSSEAMSALMAHDWPGNVRELRNILERGAVVCTGPVIQIADLGLPGKPETAPRPGTLASLEEVERRHVSAVLAHTGGNVSQSARILGIDRVTLYNKMRKWGLRRDGEDEPSRDGETGAR
ncbi:two component, sigma54 specific, transcriptional regulator, Fis family [Anaeromyxobacter dehalogenans 2CP-1]|uniref:Two component, sigma54 specific, transcriptional regulator, Fis family n=1 Tax=Anaeromyxobacter dehalogenans (strain ATCC BAA-258 / DSM 21875 / 2CP-1) TaxID=455488 RepID=B8J7A6_ANAD2|nr:sigma-54 dependent transcriptional regulator [Anaeromyxobacter dehalogenans]ACL65296.1 two component, sigma54 specific, transcriptional regulator, Fis family [Anaeromyxobacter dehalogenans 2CP-1]